MAKLRRRKIGTVFGVGIQTLLQDAERDRREREAEAKRAEIEAKAKTNEQLNIASAIIRSFVDGNGVYDEVKAQLETISGALSGEAKKIVERYVLDANQVRDSRKANDVVEDFNKGRATYDESRKKLNSLFESSKNEVLRANLSKSLDNLRVAENGRLLNKWLADYRNGKMNILEYTNSLHNLRSQSDQKDPAQVATIESAITAAEINEQALQDQKVIAAYQGRQLAPEEALQYFNRRAALAKTPEEAAAIGRIVGTITQDIARRGEGATKAKLTAIDETAAKIVGDAKTQLDADVLAAGDDPLLVIDAYKRFGQSAADASQMGGSHAEFYAKLTFKIDEVAPIAAANAVFKGINTRVNDLEKGLSDEKLSALGKIDLAGEIADELIDGENNPWTTQAQKEAFKKRREKPARFVQEIYRDLTTGFNKAITEQLTQTNLLYSDAKSYLDKGLKSMLAQVETPNKGRNVQQGIIFDNTPADQNAFLEYLRENPERVSKIVGGLGTRKTTYVYKETKEDTSRIDKLVAALEASKGLNEDATAAIRMFGNIVFPGYELPNDVLPTRIKTPAIDESPESALARLDTEFAVQDAAISRRGTGEEFEGFVGLRELGELVGKAPAFLEQLGKMIQEEIPEGRRDFLVGRTTGVELKKEEVAPPEIRPVSPDLRFPELQVPVGEQPQIAEFDFGNLAGINIPSFATLTATTDLSLIPTFEYPEINIPKFDITPAELEPLDTGTKPTGGGGQELISPT